MLHLNPANLSNFRNVPQRLLELPNLRLWQTKWFLFWCTTRGCGKPSLSFSTGPKSAFIPAQHGPAFSFRVIFVPSSMGNHHKNGGRRHPGASPFYTFPALIFHSSGFKQPRKSMSNQFYCWICFILSFSTLNLTLITS